MGQVLCKVGIPIIHGKVVSLILSLSSYHYHMVIKGAYIPFRIIVIILLSIILSE